MGSTTVLLVDDSATFRNVARRFLEEHSNDEVRVVGAVARAEDALAEAARLRPHVVLVDLHLEGLSGLDAIPRLRRLLPGAGLIALSLLDGREYREAVLEAGGNDFVSKHTMADDLLPAIRRAMAAADSPSGP